MSDKLKPCPFCGEDEALTMTNLGGKFHIECDTCEARGPREYSRKSARKAWNDGITRS